jgi:SET domain-containing protein
MSTRTVRVGRSSAGLGLFAVKPIAKRAYIATYRGKRIPTKDAHDQEWRWGAKYMFEINGKWTINGASRRNLGRYINHSCRPNAEAILRSGQIVFVALRTIAVEQEITMDYGKEYFDAFIKPLGCRCVSCKRKRAKVRRERRSAALAHTRSLRRD